MSSYYDKAQQRAGITVAVPSRKAWSSRYPAERQKYNFSRLQSYEAEKARWIAANPEATPRQYQGAMNRICKACGV